MSTLKVNNLQVGQDGTPTNNYTLYQPASPDGTVRLGYGVAGSVTDILTLKNSKLGIGTDNPVEKLEVYDGNIQQYNSNSTGGIGLILQNYADGGSGNTEPYSFIKAKSNPIRNAGEIRFGRDSAYGSAAEADSHMSFWTALNDTNIERLRITSTGSVGIGMDPTSQYFNNLVVGNNDAGDKGITIRSNSGNSGILAFSDTDTGDANRYDGYIRYSHVNQSMVFYTNGANERASITSSGKLIVSKTESEAVGGGHNAIQTSGNISVLRRTNDVAGPYINLGKSRNTTEGQFTILQNGDICGSIGFCGDDGTDINSPVAYINGLVDGTPSLNNIPGALSFRTTTSGTATIERLRIDSSGNVNLVSGSSTLTNLNFTENQLNPYARIEGGKSGSGIGDLRFHTYSGGLAERFRISSAGKVRVGSGNAAYNLEVQSTGFVETMVGSTNAGGAGIILDGDSNGDGSGGDYAQIFHNTDGTLNFRSRNPDGGTDTIFYSNTTETLRIFKSGVLSQKLTASGSHYASHVLAITTSTSPTQLKITTKIPFTGVTHAYTLHISGFVYGTAQSCDLKICWHVYNNSFYNRNASSSGSWSPTITLGVENGYVVVHLSPGPGYWPKLFVESIYGAYGSPVHNDDWSWSESAISGDSGKPVETVPYKSSFGNVNVKNSKLGIGETTPDNLLHIKSASTPAIELEQDDGSSIYKGLIKLAGNDLEIRGSNGQLEFYTGDSDGDSSFLRAAITSAGHKWTHNGSIFHGSNDVTDFTDAGRATYNNVSIRAGNPSAGTTPTNDKSAIKIYPVGTRDATTGNLTGGIAWQHLDPNNGAWATNYGAGAQIWMGAALHDTPGQERDRFNLWMNSQTTGNSQPNNLAIEAYPNGMVRHPKVPAFHASGNTNALANNTNTIIVGPNADVNNGSCYSTSNGRFTAPIDGIYQFSFWGLLYPYSGGVVNIFYSKNGVQWGDLIQGGADSNNHTTRSGIVIMSMNANDYAELRINRGSTGSVNAYGSQWNMCGFLVG